MVPSTVGVHGDSLVNEKRGGNFPIMNLNERALSVMGCRHVDDVLIDSPFVIDHDMIKSLNISVVVDGSLHSGKRRTQRVSEIDP